VVELRTAGSGTVGPQVGGASARESSVVEDGLTVRDKVVRPIHAKFDDYESDYQAQIDRSIGFAGRDHSFYVAAKAQHLLGLISRHVGDPSRQRVLDVGCGPGLAHRYLRDLTRLEGVDVSESMVERGRQTNPGVAYHVGDALALPFDAQTFDVAFATTVLHHVDPEHWSSFACELHRVLRPRGMAVIFEHNPLNPLSRRAVHRCEFDDDAVLLSGRKTRRLMEIGHFDIVEERYILLTPWTNGFARWLEGAAKRLPFGAQYYVAGRA
jgi:SAM-dependent methyltransferase